MDTDGARNHLIDVARLTSVAVVVVFHCLLYQIVVVNGSPGVVPWAPHQLWWAASWFFMSIPVLFIAGGFANTLVVDRMRDQGNSYGRYLAVRGRRLVGPLVLFVAFNTLVSTYAAWQLDYRVSVRLSVQFAQLLWFITVYLVIVGLAPFLVTAHDRWGIWPMVMVAVLAVGVDTWSFVAGEPGIRNLNLLLVWPFCHQLGIAYYRGWFRTGPSRQPLAAVALGAVLIAVLIFGAGYPPSAVGLGDIPIANVQPPTVAMIALGTAQAGILGLCQRAGYCARLSPPASRFVAIGNALAVTVYLWHIPCILLAGYALFAMSRLTPGQDWVYSQPMVIAATAVVISLLIPLIGRVERRLIPPLGDRPSVRTLIVSYTALTIGTALVWLHGTVLHPGQAASVMGVALFAVGALSTAQAVRGDRVRGPAHAT